VDISVPGHFAPWAGLICRMLASSCSRVSRVSIGLVKFRVKVRFGTNASRD